MLLKVAAPSPCTSAKDPKDAASRSATFGTSIFHCFQEVGGWWYVPGSKRLIYAHPNLIANPHGYRALFNMRLYI